MSIKDINNALTNSIFFYDVFQYFEIGYFRQNVICIENETITFFIKIFILRL